MSRTKPALDEVEASFNGHLSGKINNRKRVLPSSLVSVEFSKVIKVEMANILTLLKQFDRDYKKQLHTEFKDYLPSFDSVGEDKNRDNPHHKPDLISKSTYHTKYSRIEYYNSPESRNFYEERLYFKFTSEQEDRFKSKKNISLSVIKKDLIGEYEY